MGGLAEVVRRRGGIGTLYSSEIILLLNFWFVFPSVETLTDKH